MLIHDPGQLIRTLAGMPRECEWLEFKLNEFNRETIGKYVSALSNAAILNGKDCGYLVFGIEDGTHAIVGTSLKIAHEKVGNDTFLFWLGGRMQPRVTIEHARATIDDKPVEVLAIGHGYQEPIKFNGVAYIRIDTSLQPLNNDSARQRALWQATNRFSFEQMIAKAHLAADDLEAAFFLKELAADLKSSAPTASGMLDLLANEGLIRDNQQGGYDVNNLLVLSAARDFRDWPGLERKGVRVIHYSGKSKLDAKTDVSGSKGYSVTFDGLLDYVMERVPHREDMRHGKRVTVYDIPRITVREVLANAIIHQDLTVAGDGPVVEIYSDRIKITNPGQPLIATERFIDASQSRNAKFGRLMYRLRLCEERGSGIDRAVDAIERAILPPPFFQVVEGNTVATLYGPRQFANMTTEERLRACYQHACLLFESGESMSNSSLRQRLGLSDRQASSVTAVINDAKAAGLIKPVGEDQANRNARYIPIWA